MKAIDTNVLVRFLLKDDDKQSPIVYQFFKHTWENGEQLFVPSVVILELNWVLSKHYHLSRQRVISALQDVLLLPFLHIEHKGAIELALNFAKENTFDISDLLIGYIAKHHNYTTTLTFDKKAAKATVFELII